MRPMTEDGEYYKQNLWVGETANLNGGYPLVPSIFLSLVDEIHIYVYQLPFQYCSYLLIHPFTLTITVELEIFTTFCVLTCNSAYLERPVFICHPTWRREEGHLGSDSSPEGIVTG